MTWQVVARHDSSVTVSAKSVKLLLGTLAFVVALAGYIYPLVGTAPITTARFPGFVTGSLTTLVPFVGMLMGYGAIVGERESGSLLLSLSLPHSRRDVVFGKLCSRAGLVTTVVVGSLLAAGGFVVYPFGDLVLGRFLGYVALAALFAVVWSGLGLAVSLAVATRRRALVLGFGLVFLFGIVWDTVAEALTRGLNAAGIIDGEMPEVLRFVVGVEPGNLFGRVTTGFITPEASISGPWYLNEWVALVLLAIWAVGPLGLAYYRFERSDLS
jgi:ABC-type transport system involved in multi-copper enzyme maturation permease subunit